MQKMKFAGLLVLLGLFLVSSSATTGNGEEAPPIRYPPRASPDGNLTEVGASDRAAPIVAPAVAAALIAAGAKLLTADAGGASASVTYRMPSGQLVDANDCWYSGSGPCPAGDCNDADHVQGVLVNEVSVSCKFWCYWRASCNKNLCCARKSSVNEETCKNSNPTWPCETNTWVCKDPRYSNWASKNCEHSCGTCKCSSGYMQRWKMCGTRKCKACTSGWCMNDSNSGLDRDKDKEDLKRCEQGFVDKGFKIYPQHWPLADVHLRICATC